MTKKTSVSNLHVADDTTPAWSPLFRVFVSVLICFHLSAVFVGPWSDPPPSSALSQRVASFFRPYLKAACLDNGYRFFAPDPGPSHLIRFEIFDADNKIASGKFPDRDVHWPRLLYHRYFMISEMMYSIVGPTLDLPPTEMLSAQDREEIRRQQDVANELQRGVARVLLRQHENATRVRLFLVNHAIPAPGDVVRGMRLDAPDLYREILLGEFDRSTVAEASL